jgi:16S rRNA (adenine1518-N6/adenine1519-N6)-dimethyltransferase
MKAKKSLGQNFLKSKSVLNKITKTADIKSDDLILEIGPGKGALTEFLLKEGKVLAIEKDKDLIGFLEEKFKDEVESGRLTILEEDVLDFDQSKLSAYKVVANIPYYITGEIIEKFLSENNKPQSMTLLVQKEVAERIAKSEKESILSLSIKVFGDPEYKGVVKKELFSPKPKVDSAILHINSISNKKLEGVREERFFEVVKSAFGHKRKRVLKNLGEKITPEKLTQCKIKENDRAEDLSLSQYICLSKD